ncbi:MAG TPA: DUF503 domain-containing protein [Ktedonobacterales bacterium]|nr:DUF503 domain-containing protein [Ktedonobacterales bacterium]
MYTAIGQVTLHLPASASLKDKRQVVRSVLARLRNQFEVSAAEVARQDSWQVAVLGLAYVSGEAGHAQEVLDHAVRYIEDSRPDLAVTDVRVDVLPFGD